MRGAGVRAASSSGLHGSNAPAKVGNNLLILTGMNNKRSIHKSIPGLYCSRKVKGNLDASVGLVNVYVCRKEQLYSLGLKCPIHSFGNI